MKATLRDYQIHTGFASCQPIKHTSFNQKANLMCVVRVNGSIELWSSDGPLIKLLQYPRLAGAHLSLFLADGRLIAASVDGSVLELSLRSATSDLLFHAQGGAPWNMAEMLSEDRCTKLLIASEDGSVRQYDCDSWTLDRQLVHGNSDERLVSLCVGQSQTWVASGGCLGSVHFVLGVKGDLQSATLQPIGIIWALCEVADGSETDPRVVSGDSKGRLCLWQVSSATRLCTVMTHSADILCVAFHSNRVYAAGVDSKIVQLNVHKDVLRKVKSIAFNSHDVRGLHVHGQKNMLVAASSDGIIRSTLLFDLQPDEIRIGSLMSQPYYPLVRFATSYFACSTAESGRDLLLYDTGPSLRFTFRTASSSRLVRSFDVFQFDCSVYVAYTDDHGTAVVTYSRDEEGLKFEKVEIALSGNKSYNLVRFGKNCVGVSTSNTIDIFDLFGKHATQAHTVSTLKCPVLMHIENKSLFAVVNIDGEVCLESKKRRNIVTPQRSGNEIVRQARATCLCFSRNIKGQSSRKCLVAYSNMMIIEVEIKSQEWTDWTRRVNWPEQWVRSNNIILSVAYVNTAIFARLRCHFLLVRSDESDLDVERNTSTRQSGPYEHMLLADIGDCKPRTVNLVRFTAEAALKATPMTAKIRRFNT